MKNQLSEFRPLQPGEPIISEDFWTEPGVNETPLSMDELADEGESYIGRAYDSKWENQPPDDFPIKFWRLKTPIE